MWEAKFPPFCRAGAYPSPLWPSAISPRQGESSPAAPWVILPAGGTGGLDVGYFALRGELLCPRRQSNQNAAGAARCGLPLNQVPHNGAGQPSQAPRNTIGKPRRRRTVAETSCFLATQGLGGPEGEATKSDLARRMKGMPFLSDIPWGPGPKPRRFFGYFCISTKVLRPRAKHPLSPVPPAGDYSYQLNFTVQFRNRTEPGCRDRSGRR